MGQLVPDVFNKQEEEVRGQVIDTKGILKALARCLSITHAEFPGFGSNK